MTKSHRNIPRTDQSNGNQRVLLTLHVPPENLKTSFARRHVRAETSVSTGSGSQVELSQFFTVLCTRMLNRLTSLIYLKALYRQSDYHRHWLCLKSKILS